MKLKINKYEFDVSNKDWILDNGCYYQCMTLTHKVLEFKVKLIDSPTRMSKKQFEQLVKENRLIDCTEQYFKKYPNSLYKGCKIWKFNV